ncbi:cupin domain-containing protein [Deinococcus cellulosilyticus]|uniref:Cupin n=1 Tax=Deinococcus cellulosilyticus (strain DSM 18568 / NBRC 106333 / KACC 11606 / 5516J-15) TaxID=1223518 RepID=A0A511N6X6_DEIC1|nr:cupin domain-containing protein [Deinococcus cellulosilyticus]GEM48595.1 cupin [Deinococcus cellulosilyticus NBRC 106333 = KACC 11606]
MESTLLTCKVVRSDEQYRGKQGLDYQMGISTQSTGSQGLCMHLNTFPPGAKAKAHLHQEHETAIYMLKGEVGMWYGEGLKDHLVVRAGDYLYIPANMPHLPYNMSQTEEAVALLARTDPNEQESVTLLPDLDAVHL